MNSRVVQRLRVMSARLDATLSLGFFRRSLFSGLAVIAGSFLPAQPAPTNPASAEELVTLSPFVVQTSQDRGYQASATLAGTRLNTPLGDLGAPITAITKDFFQDTGVTDINQLFLYTVSTEGSGLLGNYSATVIGDEYPELEAARRRPQTGTRVRGLVAADLTRDYFISMLPMEEYNLERVDISRGPNAVLFGLGSPAGVANSTLISPSYNKNAYKLQLRYGDHDSYRSVVDLNQILIPQKLAARVALLGKETRWEQKPTFERDNRIYAAVKANPFKDTTVSANYEYGKIKARRPMWTNPADRISPFFITGKPTHDAGRDTDLAGPIFPPQGHYDAGISVFQFASLFQQPVVVDEANSQSPSMSGWIAQRGANQTNPNTPGVIPSVLRFVGIRFPGELGNDMRHTGVPLSVFNFREQLLGGELGFSKSGFHAFNAAINQDFLNRKIGFQLAYAKETFDDYYYEPFADQRYRLNVDVNTTLVDGRPNPNFGRPWVYVAGPRPKYGTVGNESWRGTVYAKWDAAEHFKTGFGRWLGRHTLTGLVSTQTSDTFDRQAGLGFGGAAIYNLAATSASEIAEIIYVGPSIANLTSFDQVHLNFNLTTRLLKEGDDAGPIVYWDRNTSSFRTGTFPLEAFWRSALMQRQKINSQAGILQSYWLKDMLISTVGWRRDESKSYTSQIAPPRIAGGDLNNTIDIGKVALGGVPLDQTTGEIWTYSGVAKLPRSLELPYGLDASIHYSQSENFQPNTGQVSITGDKLPPPSGKTKEYGFTVFALKNRVSVKVNWYKTELDNARNTEINNFLTGGVLNNDFQTADLWYQGLANNITGPGMPTQADIDKLVNSIPQSVRDMVGYKVLRDSAGRPSGAQYSFPTSIIADSNNIVAKGLEIESTVNLTNNWRVAFNAAKQRTIKSNIAPFMTAYIAARKTVWDQLAPLQKSPLAPSNPGSFGTETARIVYFLLDQTKATEGTYSPDLRKWRFNFVNNYTFPRDSALRGFAVGGAYRWQDKAAVDYPLVTTSTGAKRSDISHPWFTPAVDQVDAWVSYSRPLYNNKVRWRLQFNVGDVFAKKNGVIPVAYQPWGDVAYVRATPPRTWFLESTFEY